MCHHFFAIEIRSIFGLIESQHNRKMISFSIRFRLFWADRNVFEFVDDALE